jgi:bacterioferritin-associated ferredoxin
MPFGDVHHAMIVCSCNVLSDHQVRSAVNATAVRSPGQVYGCLGCSVQCGRCARTIRKIMDEASATCADNCCNSNLSEC